MHQTIITILHFFSFYLIQEAEANAENIANTNGTNHTTTTSSNINSTVTPNINTTNNAHHHTPASANHHSKSTHSGKFVHQSFHFRRFILRISLNKDFSEANSDHDM